MKKEKYFQMNVTRATTGEKIPLRLPKRYRAIFDKALLHNCDDYENSVDALCRFYEDYFDASEADREFFQEIIACGLASPKSIVDFTIILQTLDQYCVIRNVSSPADVAAFYSFLAKKFEPDSLTAKMTEDMYAEIGQKVVNSENGRFCNGNYYVKLQNQLKIK